MNSGIFGWVVQLSTISVFSDNVPRKFWTICLRFKIFEVFLMELIALMSQIDVAEHRCFLVSQFMQSSSLGSIPSRGHALCSWARHLTLTVPLHPGV